MHDGGGLGLNGISLYLHTVRHLRPIQVWNRLWRQRWRIWPWKGRGWRPSSAVREAAGPVRRQWPRCGAVWDGASTFTFLNETRRIDAPEHWDDPGCGRLWRYNLHYFDCLRQEPRPPAAAAEGLVLRWINENPAGRGSGWEPYPVSLRIVNWVKWLLGDEVSACRDAGTRERVVQSLAMQAAGLARRLEYHLLANHLLANAKALVFAGVFLEGTAAARWYRTGMDIYRRELPVQILSDGIHFELSAMYHSIILEDLLDVVNLLEGTSPDPARREDAAFLRGCAARMLHGLETLTGPDGRIAMFNDAAHGIALAPSSLESYARRLGVAADPARRDGPDSGYVRLDRDGWTLIVKCGQIGPDFQPGHAHADSLTFELWREGRKAVSDTGTDRYAIDEQRLYQRGTAAHNTVSVDGCDSSEVWGGHRVARRATPLSVEVDVAACRVTAAVRDCRGFTHRRTLELTAKGLHGIDEIGGAGCHKVAARFHMTRCAMVSLVAADGLSPHSEDCLLACEFGKLCDGTCEVLERTGDLPVKLEWDIVHETDSAKL